MGGYYNYGWQGGNVGGQQSCSNYSYGGGYGGGYGGSGNMFVLIVVLFILLIIVGSVII
ncbi:YjcZ family sporulation protein [Lysinibacillus sp. 3P01SB]|uniref:YjcZ family sporulation protein n=1 Tax=Lysinibacillus sp. 3P01SB TaxID=3132284 RepID=UPI0039A3FED9